MGFYLRKSIRVGPLRFNLSNSGIGASVGVKGFRVGTGPRGNYVHMGYGGVYYRSSFPSSKPNSADSGYPEDFHATAVQMQEIGSGSVGRMVDSSSAEFLEEINRKVNKWLLWPWILAAAAGLGLFQLPLTASGVISPMWLLLTVPLSITACVGAYYRDQLRKTVVLFYEMEPHLEAAYENLHVSVRHLASCNRVWHVGSSGRITNTYQWKTNAGASSLVKRRQIGPKFGLPPYFKSNVLFPVLPAGQQTLYFLPDRVLVYDGTRVGAVNYNELAVCSEEARFIEDAAAPGDARVVDRTWRYVNVSGGPDRRFKDNREMPVCLYGKFTLISYNGLQEAFMTSQVGTGIFLEEAIRQMASALVAQAVREKESAFSQCTCNHCSVIIEYPEHGIGETVACPHCGLETVLFKSHLG